MAASGEAAALLKGTVQGLNNIMQRAVSAGEYRYLPALAKTAQTLSGLAEQFDGPRPLLDIEAPKRLTSKRPPSASSKRPPASRRPNAGYPKFRRDGDKLVKIGWSKSQRSEYEHRAPKVVAHVLFGSMSHLDKRQFPVPVEKLLPLTDPLDNTEIPPHQVYLALGWLKSEGIVRQHGRDGYSLAVNGDASKIVEQRWAALPNR